MSPRGRKCLKKINFKFMPVQAATRDGSAHQEDNQDLKSRERHDEKTGSLKQYVMAQVSQSKDGKPHFRRHKKSSLPRIES